MAGKSKKAGFARARLREIIFNKKTNIFGLFRSQMKEKTQQFYFLQTFPQFKAIKILQNNKFSIIGYKMTAILKIYRHFQ